MLYIQAMSVYFLQTRHGSYDYSWFTMQRFERRRVLGKQDAIIVFCGVVEGVLDLVIWYIFIIKYAWDSYIRVKTTDVDKCRQM